MRAGVNLHVLPEHLLDGASGSENATQMDDRAEEVTGKHRFQIRRAETRDAQGIAECLRAAFASVRDQYTAGSYVDTVLDPQGVLARMGEMCLFVAVSDGFVVGTVGCKVNGVEGHLRGMGVLPDWQGTGVASALLGAAESELRKRACGLITLDTTEPLVRAIQFYKRNGYSSSGRVSDFFGMRLYEYRKVLH